MTSYQATATLELLSLIPKCGSCLEDFDTFLRAPQILPCCHTFCLMCISKDSQRKKRKCLLCKEKYSRFIVNTAYLVLIARVHAQHRLEERLRMRCDECDNRVAVHNLRRCISCEQHIKKVLPGQTCCICLECCVDRHNGHEMYQIVTRSTPSHVRPSQDTRLSQPRQQKFVRRAPFEGPLLKTPPSCARSSSSESNSNSHHSSSRNKTPFKPDLHRNDTHSDTPMTEDRVESSSRRGLNKLSDNEGIDFGWSIDSTLSYVENTEYLRGGLDAESGFCSAIRNSPGCDGEQTLTNTQSGGSASEPRDSDSTNSTPRLHVPNMPRRNRFRGAPHRPLFNTDLDSDSELMHMDSAVLGNGNNEYMNGIKQKRGSSLRATPRSVVVNSEYASRERIDHHYENIQMANCEPLS